MMMNRFSWCLWTRKGLNLALLGLLTACGGIVSNPSGGGTSVPVQESLTAAQNPTTQINAAAPSLEGILSAPADDDNIVNTGKLKVVHFEAFFGKGFSNFLDDYVQVFLDPKDLLFLVKVGEASTPSCQGMEDPGCWNWFDPNLLEGLVLRITVSTSGPDSPNEEGLHLLTAKWYYQDYLLTKVTEEGFNLSLLDLNPSPGDLLNFTLYEKKPDNYSAQRSALFDGYPGMISGDGNHQLGIVQIGAPVRLTPLIRKP